MEEVIMKSQGVCKVLMGLWSFISLGPGVSTIQAREAFCSWKILPLACFIFLHHCFPCVICTVSMRRKRLREAGLPTVL